MPLLLFDLDNTLLPRDAAYRAWAQDFLAEHSLPATDLDWLSTLDGSGYVPRSTVLGAAKRRYGLDHSLDFLLAHYRRGINSHIACPDSHVKALRAARSAGWTLGIVSNGGTRPQLEKIRRTGLGALVDGWVISEEADCLKPDPLIFEIAAQRCGVPPGPGWTSQTWMVGDHAPADIAGAEATGLRSVWLHHDRPWSEPGYRPTLSARGLPEAVGMVLTARNAPTTGSLGTAGSRGTGLPGRPRLRRQADQFATAVLADQSAAAADRRAGRGTSFARPASPHPVAPASLGAFAYPAEGAGAVAG
ncbi:HAD family hydrolase [Kitasatospora sp. NBC_00374]|uniref:HAD family hydrolase n=1 Tax=Kitasatospora sp. NBC_00374 TaxID=2975964 RepID=UPI0030E1721E